MSRLALYSHADLSVNATAWAGGRQIDKTANGVRWLAFWDGGSNPSGSPAGSVIPLRFMYRTSDAEPWAEQPAMALPWQGTGSNAANPTLSMFVDAGDFMHLFVKDRGNQTLWYRRGTPTDASRTNYTWSDPVTISGNTGAAYPDLIAHRSPDGVGWWVHFVWGIWNSHSQYRRMFIAEDGTFGAPTVITQLSGTANTNVGQFPMLSFHHTGDGKTVKDGTPHVYVAYMAGSTTAATLNFRRFAYAAGSWTMGAQRQLYGAWLMTAIDLDWFQIAFTGNDDIYIFGTSYTGSARNFRLYRRLADDSAGAQILNLVGNDGFIAGAARLRPDGDGLFIYGTLNAADGRKLRRHEWVESTNAIDAGEGTVIDDVAVVRNVKTLVGRSATEPPLLYLDESTAPYTLTVEDVEPPAVPGAWVWDGAAWVAQPWRVADAGGALQTHPVHYWDGAAWQPGPTL